MMYYYDTTENVNVSFMSVSAVGLSRFDQRNFSAVYVPVSSGVYDRV